MKIILNKCYGGFHFSREMKEILSKMVSENVEWEDDFSMDSSAISLIEAKGSEWASGRHSKLEVVEVPPEATDWCLEEDDGYERIVYVVNGKLHWV